MINLKSELRNKVTYDYKKLINDKYISKQGNVNNYETLNHQKSKDVLPIITIHTVDRQDDIKTDIKISLFTKLASVIVTPFKVKLDKRIKKLNYFNSNPFSNNTYNLNEEKEETPSLCFINNLIEDNHMNKSNTNLIANIYLKPIKTVKNSSFKSKKKDNLLKDIEFSKSLEIRGNIEKNYFEKDGIKLSVGNEIALKHLNIIELWIDLENVIVKH